jgi:flagellar assembly protein FliH
MTNSSDSSYPLAFPPPPEKAPSPAVPAFPPPPRPPATPATRAFPPADTATVRFGEAVLHDDRAGAAPAARFDVDLRKRQPPPDESIVEARTAAEAAGYAAGWAQGRREAQDAAIAAAERDAVNAEEVLAAQEVLVQRAVNAVAKAATELEHRAIPVVTEIENALADAALAIAEAIVGQQLRTATEPGREALARALALAPVARPVTVRLNPADLLTITTKELVVDGRTVTLIGDTTLKPGDSVAICDATTVDARLGPAIERVREVLGR